MKLLIGEILIILIFFGCDNKVKTARELISTCEGNIQTINFGLLLDSTTSYDGKLVEVTGYYHEGFEESAISNSIKRPDEKSMIWVNFAPNVIDSFNKNPVKDQDIYEYLDGKRILIRGMVNPKAKGHMGQYAASMELVCYVAVFD